MAPGRQFCPFRLLARWTLWLAFDEVSRENGCMCVIPGSHYEKPPCRHNEDKTLLSPFCLESNSPQGYDKAAASEGNIATSPSLESRVSEATGV